MIKKQLVKTIKLILMLTGFVVLSCTPNDENDKQRALPILGEKDVEYIVKDGKEVADTIYHRVPEFEYLNQDSIMIMSADLKDKVWVADFFFTYCPSICPPMTSQMKRLNANTRDLSEHVQFLSFSIDPERDSPNRLKEYIDQYGIDATNWHFFTGQEEEATHLLAKEFFNGAERNDEIEGGFGHTPNFVLVDTDGLVRGIYDGTVTEEVDRLETELRLLLEKEYGVKSSK